ncbi:class I SAM-dependent methyltransferase [Algicola sagamiensis]|uniref:class I SAM-dependent methyltransferase n=1 Tax=Algicola sagamiensis TaxID=163869 RepID=UPI0003768855|nr:class I SAM-dependent methyltransferase [Algicola sagamiensis]
MTHIPQADYDVVGHYNQDKINGFTDDLLTQFIQFINPSQNQNILDVMGGNGNLTRRLLDHCTLHGISQPKSTLFELSKTQTDIAKSWLSPEECTVVCGDILTLEHDHETSITEQQFDCIFIKSANHEIPLSLQNKLYHNLFQLLRPGGQFINLGFLFDCEQEREELAGVTKIKDKLVGMENAVKNRYFLMRHEFYGLLEQTGFEQISSASRFDYRICSDAVKENYFPGQNEPPALRQIISAQRDSITLVRNNRILFEQSRSTMALPGEITIARKPT